MNPSLHALLKQTDAVMSAHPPRLRGRPTHVGVDLGTAYTVLVVLNEAQQPLAGAYQFAQVVRDGLVVDFHGAISLLQRLKKQVEQRLGVELTHAASGFPPGVPRSEVRATANVLIAAGLECTDLIDEPSAANNVLQIRDGAIVDVGGGTTGIAIVKHGQVIYTADEPTGGTHFSLVLAGGLGLTFEQAEELKKNPREQARLFPVLRPVMEKVGSIVRRHVAGHAVDTLYLVGGTCAYPGMAQVIEEYTGIKTLLPGNPLFITPLGIAMHDRADR
ncbi:ethanolamine utilization protein EutJ [Candidatus Amarolinea aalborgensis]|uniref:ethanolamine utilization protein EutJ n=1 Tax=Candidatus Amarolinea aalborgensis TaxID=2249329 RepID=UPI003BF9EA41